MTFEELETEISKISYKPGWEIRTYQALVFTEIVITALRNNSDEWSPQRDADEYGKIIITSKYRLSGSEVHHLTKDILKARIQDFILRAEVHEIEEWLRVDGKRFREPHN